MAADNLVQKNRKLIVVSDIKFMSAYPLTGSVNALFRAQQSISIRINQRHLTTQPTQSLSYCQADPASSTGNDRYLVIK